MDRLLLFVYLQVPYIAIHHRFGFHLQWSPRIRLLMGYWGKRKSDSPESNKIKSGLSLSISEGRTFQSVIDETRWSPRVKYFLIIFNLIFFHSIEYFDWVLAPLNIRKFKFDFSEWASNKLSFPKNLISWAKFVISFFPNTNSTDSPITSLWWIVPLNSKKLTPIKCAQVKLTKWTKEHTLPYKIHSTAMR